MIIWEKAHQKKITSYIQLYNKQAVTETFSQDISYASAYMDSKIYSILSEKEDIPQIKEFSVTNEASNFINKNILLKKSIKKFTGYLYNILESLRSSYIVLLDVDYNELDNKEYLRISIFVRDKSVGEIIDFRNNLNTLFYQSLNKITENKEEISSTFQKVIINFDSIN